MGASPKHKPSPEGIQALGWLNAQPPVDPSHRALYGRLKSRLGKVARGQREVKDTLQWCAHALGSIRFVLFLYDEPRRAVWVPDFMAAMPLPDGSGGREGQAFCFYIFACLLNDVWEKGAERLKICQWEGCSRFIWDPTTNCQKVYCEKIHDTARAIRRQKESR